MKLSCFFLITLAFPVISFSQKVQPETPLETVELIKKYVACEWSDKTVDTFKAGNPETKLTGVAVCMFADMLTIKKAAQLGCNLIITHEPVFYNHSDKTSQFKSDPVYLEKIKFIQENNLVIFRFHDHIHRTNPDGIYEGMLNKLDLKDYSVDGSTYMFNVPETTVRKYVNTLKKKLDLTSLRVIGKKNMKFTKLGFAAGATGGSSHIKMLANPGIEVLVAGEAPEWETYLYTNDAIAQGKNKAVIFLGHIKSEEAGMEYCASWLKTFIQNIPIHFIENNSNFTDL